ncbi:MAG: sulfatase-like hydrolase/transferase [Anaerolineales bacterium]|jgi:arylsulfatase A-like enzyme
MKKMLSRREFLKLSSCLPLAFYTPPKVFSQDSSQPNILVIVFDAFSARNITFQGYPRNTMPLTSKLIERATVYHNHFAGGNFTSPGTASLLTGTYPWTHRAYKIRGEVAEPFLDRNLFSLFEQYYRLSYTHNPLVSVQLKQLFEHIDFLKRRDDLAFGRNKWIFKLFADDEDIANVSWLQMTERASDSISNSLLLSPFYEFFGIPQSSAFPRGLPEIEKKIYFLLEDAIDWTIATLRDIPQPFMGYLHYFPPHDPYHTREDFIDAFKDDGYEAIRKPHDFARFFDIIHTHTPEMLDEVRTWYDEFILYLDYEFNRLFEQLEREGILDNTWVIVTSDHGELMERGKIEHMLPLLYLPLVQIPLLIFAPGQKERQDIYTPTSAIDVLPTLLHLIGQEIPTWLEGEVLPPYQTSPVDPQRSIFCLEAKNSDLNGPLDPYTAMIVKGEYKLTYYSGYEALERKTKHYDLYNIVKDPEEMDNIVNSSRSTAEALLAELQTVIRAADQQFRS